MSSTLNSGVRCVYMCGGAAWGMLTGKGRQNIVLVSYIGVSLTIVISTVHHCMSLVLISVFHVFTTLLMLNNTLFSALISSHAGLFSLIRTRQTSVQPMCRYEGSAKWYEIMLAHNNLTNVYQTPKLMPANIICYCYC